MATSLLIKNRTAVPLICSTTSKTSQEFLEDADINKLFGDLVNPVDYLIVQERMKKLQEAAEKAVYLDVSEFPDFQEVQNILTSSRRVMDSLPQNLKDRFRDPVGLYDFVCNPENIDELVKLKLLPPQKEINNENISNTQTNTKDSGNSPVSEE
ncbi:internal scaffolding protein [Microviridae sp.]|nr:internal scaffolding protein [Microviridae sp.]